METLPRSRISFLGLFRALTGDTRTFVRQEIQLAKKELSEKISSLGRNAAALAVGGVIAYARVRVFLSGLGWLVAWTLEQAGLQPVLAGFIGQAGIGLITIAIGGVLLLKAVKSISKESLAPERTIATLQELKGEPSSGPTGEPEAPKGSSEEIQARVEATENRLGQTLSEIGRRLSPSHINAEVKERISAKPYSSGLIAMIVGIVSGLMLRRKLRHA